MAMKPLPAWIKDYQPKVEEHYEKAANEENPASGDLWANWVDENATGIQVVPPYQSNGTTNKKSFDAATLDNAQTGLETASILANAWQKWYLGIKFTPSPPIPPFLSITLIEPSPTGVSLAYLSLLAGLLAEMVVLPPPELNTAFLVKATAFGSLFNTATIAAGVQITGTAPGAPPVPLILPLIPVL
jgi:hypothetical protein